MQARCLARSCLWKDGKCFEPSEVANNTSIVADIATDNDTFSLHWSMIILTISVLLLVFCSCYCFCHCLWVRVSLERESRVYDTEKDVSPPTSPSCVHTRATESHAEPISSHEYESVEEASTLPCTQSTRSSLSTSTVRIKTWINQQPSQSFSQSSTEPLSSLPSDRPQNTTRIPKKKVSRRSLDDHDTLIKLSVSPQDRDSVHSRVNSGSEQELEISRLVRTSLAAAQQPLISSSPGPSESNYPYSEASDARDTLSELMSSPSIDTLQPAMCEDQYDVSSSVSSVPTFRTMRAPNSDASSYHSAPVSAANISLASSTDQDAIDDKSVPAEKSVSVARSKSTQKSTLESWKAEAVDELSVEGKGIRTSEAEETSDGVASTTVTCSTSRIRVTEPFRETLNTIPGTPSSAQSTPHSSSTFHPAVTSTPIFPPQCRSLKDQDQQGEQIQQQQSREQEETEEEEVDERMQQEQEQSGASGEMSSAASKETSASSVQSGNYYFENQATQFDVHNAPGSQESENEQQEQETSGRSATPIPRTITWRRMQLPLREPIPREVKQSNPYSERKEKK